MSFERAAERVVTSRENQDSLKARRCLKGYSKGSTIWRMADGENERRAGDGERFAGGVHSGRGNTGQDAVDSRERRDDWTAGPEGKGVRHGTFCCKRQCLPHLKKVK